MRVARRRGTAAAAASVAVRTTALATIATASIRPHAEQQALEPVGHPPCADQAERKTDRAQAECVRDDGPADAGGCGAERQADGDFSRARRDGDRQRSIHANRGKGSVKPLQSAPAPARSRSGPSDSWTLAPSVVTTLVDSRASVDRTADCSAPASAAVTSPEVLASSSPRTIAAGDCSGRDRRSWEPIRGC